MGLHVKNMAAARSDVGFPVTLSPTTRALVVLSMQVINPQRGLNRFDVEVSRLAFSQYIVNHHVNELPL